MVEMDSPRKRFVIMPAPEQPRTYVIYDSLLEQPIGRPGPLNKGIEMASYLNRLSPYVDK